MERKNISVTYSEDYENSGFVVVFDAEMVNGIFGVHVDEKDGGKKFRGTIEVMLGKGGLLVNRYDTLYIKGRKEQHKKREKTRVILNEDVAVLKRSEFIDGAACYRGEFIDSRGVVPVEMRVRVK